MLLFASAADDGARIDTVMSRFLDLPAGGAGKKAVAAGGADNLIDVSAGRVAIACRSQVWCGGVAGRLSTAEARR